MPNEIWGWDDDDGDVPPSEGIDHPSSTLNARHWPVDADSKEWSDKMQLCEVTLPKPKRFVQCSGCANVWDRKNPNRTVPWVRMTTYDGGQSTDYFRCQCGSTKYAEFDNDAVPIPEPVKKRKREPRANYRKVRVL